MYDGDGKNMNRIKSVYVNSLACVRIKGDKSECFRIGSDVRQVCIMSPWLFNMHMDAVMKEGKMGIKRMGMKFFRGRKSGECLASGRQMTRFFWGGVGK